MIVTCRLQCSKVSAMVIPLFPLQVRLIANPSLIHTTFNPKVYMSISQYSSVEWVKKMNKQEMREELNKLYEAQENEIREIRDISTFIENDVLEIRREQYLSSGEWVTSDYTLVTGTGGPHIEFDTNHQIRLYWGDVKMEFETRDPEVRKSIDRIREYLEESE